MGWGKFDDRYPSNRKVRPLSDAAFRLDVSAILWCSANLTDGLVPRDELHLASDVKRPVKAADELVRRGRWHLAGEGCDTETCPTGEPADGWQIHDYLDFNDTKQMVDARREADRNRKKKPRGAPPLPPGFRPESNGNPGAVRLDDGRNPGGGQAAGTAPETPYSPVTDEVSTPYSPVTDEVSTPYSPVTDEVSTLPDTPFGSAPPGQSAVSARNPGGVRTSARPRERTRAPAPRPVPSLTATTGGDLGSSVAVANARLLPLRTALEDVKLAVRWDKLDPGTTDRVAWLADVHGVGALVAAAQRAWQPNDPPAYANAWIPAWDSLPLPKPRLVASCAEHALPAPCISCAADRKAAQ